MKTDVNLFSRMLSVSRERGVDVQNILSCELCAVPSDLFYSNGAMRRTVKINLLESINYSKLERFSNVVDEISAKLPSSFLACEVLVVVPDMILNFQ